MAIENELSSFFKPETRSSGAKLVHQEKVAFGSGSDRAVQAFIRSTPPVKVSLSSTSIESPTILAQCSCTAAKKGQLCKHIWAALLAGEARYADFFVGKNSVEIASIARDSGTQTVADEETIESTVKSARAEERAEKQRLYEESMKARNAQYRKDQYAKQKERVKELKRGKASAGSEKNAARPLVSYPAEVEAALVYFSGNGFSIAEEFTEEALGEAKRKLSRVFHPDKGGAHEEIVELNQNWEVLIRFLRG